MKWTITGNRAVSSKKTSFRGVKRRGSRAGAVLGCFLLASTAASLHAAGPPPGVPVTVIRVLDGDTVDVELHGRTERVRVLAVDTPEAGYRERLAEPWAEEATRFTRAFLARCAGVYLEVAGDRHDQHGRTLGFLWCAQETGEPSENLSAGLLRRGLARAIRFHEYPGKSGFLALEAEARAARRGLWSGSPSPGPRQP